VAATKQTVFSWESGKTAPSGFQLAALSEKGADVLYIVTGRREVTADTLRRAVLSAVELLSVSIDAQPLAQLTISLCALPQTAAEGGGSKYAIAHNHGQVGDNMTNNYRGMK
jgi:hypothetical protein